MEIWIYYLVAIIPIIIGAIFFIKNNEIVWQEWLIGSLSALVLAGIFHLIAFYGMTSDTETWSGKITHVVKVPAWEEYYETAEYRTEYSTDRNGRTTSRRVFSHWQSHTRWNPETVVAYSDIDTAYNINTEEFNQFKIVFNDLTVQKGRRVSGQHNSRMINGDPFDYYIYNRTGWVQPITKQVKFENRIKASKTVFSFISVPTNISVYPYPSNTNPFESDRLVGTALVSFNRLEFDRLNTSLGALKQVNIILVGFGNKEQMYAEYQRAKWLGGKKNDLVICFGGGSKNSPAAWATTFGWTESELAKQNLNTLFITKPLNHELFADISRIVKTNYKIRDWSKFEYITIIPNPIYFWMMVLFMIITQSAMWWFFHINDVKKRRNLY